MQYGLIGEHLPHSFSKEIHRLIGEYDKNEYAYDITELRPDEVDSFMKKKDFKGINVTIPYKQTVIPYLDFTDDAAKVIGAVNTVVNKDGVLYGYNTDFYGLRDLITDAGISLAGKKVLILGTGGTSKTASYVCRMLNAASIHIVSRSKKDDSVITYEEAYESHADSDVIINTTPVGMFPKADAIPVEIERFPLLSGVVDVIYNPLRTRLMLDASAKGIKSCCGLRMLVTQAVYAYMLFNGKEKNMLDRPEEAAHISKIVDKVYKKVYGDKLNIVLTGMPGCGKSTVGKRLADKFGKRQFDTDKLIVDKEKRQITDIFASEGEEYFRDIESDVIKDISTGNGLIISTGGGAVLRKENVAALKSNGEVIFIDRPLDKLIPTDDRPTASDVDMLKRRYEERYNIYCDACDIKVDNDSLIEDVVMSVIQKLSES